MSKNEVMGNQVGNENKFKMQASLEVNRVPQIRTKICRKTNMSIGNLQGRADRGHQVSYYDPTIHRLLSTARATKFLVVMVIVVKVKLVRIDQRLLYCPPPTI